MKHMRRISTLAWASALLACAGVLWFWLTSLNATWWLMQPSLCG